MSDQLDAVALVLRRWRTLLICAVLGVGGGVVYGFVAPKWYEAHLSVVPAQRSVSPALSMLANLPGADAFASSASTDVMRIQSVLTSTSVLDEVIAKLGLQERYGTSYIEHTREELLHHCIAAVDRKPAIVTLTCEDKVPEQAVAMAELFGDVANKVFQRISASSAREERKFLETQVVKARKDVDDASAKLREFQEQHRVIDLTEQSKAVIGAMASVEGELVSKQLQLSYLTTFSSSGEANVVQLQHQISIMEDKLQQLEASQPKAVALGSGSGSDAKFFPDAMKVPELRFELEQLYRQQKIEETVFFLLTQRYETAKVDEARDTSTFQILDHPTLPQIKSRPKRRVAVLAGAAGGGGVGILFVLIPAWWRRRARVA
jgi:uncharacterized protein involved in exopolysaccharide biosynthesis